MMGYARKVQSLGSLHRRLIRRAGDVLFDKMVGMETAEEIWHGLPEFDEDRGHGYMASSWLNLLILRRILSDITISTNDVFIDFGSGKGRVLYLAALYPFRKVIGVEISEKLNQIARENLRKNVHRLVCKDIQLVTSDVAQYEIPDDVTVVYFYNPFEGEIFTDTIDKICASLAKNPRELRVIYANPVMHDYLIQNGFRITKRASIPSFRSSTTRRVFLYTKGGASGVA